MKRYFTLATLLMLGACSSGAPQPIDPPLTATQATAALNSAFADLGGRYRDPYGKPRTMPAVSVDSIDGCTGSSARALCKVDFSSSDGHASRAVIFWKTANPRHPWRAALFERSQP